MMLRHPNFLLLDEPTNHLDLESITALNNGLKEFKGNLILTTHDHAILQSVCNRIIEITPNGIIDSLMSFDDYVRSDRIKAQRKEMYEGVAA
jgi:ATPase subunit of ABC transporter with duplicated ATPase domains